MSTSNPFPADFKLTLGTSDQQSYFFFNSSLVSESQSEESFLKSLGPSSHGYLGQNLGNGYITHGTIRSIFGRNLSVPHLPNAWEEELNEDFADAINKNYKIFVFICQDFIREGTKNLDFYSLTNFLKKIKIPIMPLSLGANSFNGYDPNLKSKLTADQINFLKVLAEKSPVIGVRGEYTESVLSSLNIKNSMIIGCPSYFANGKNRVIRPNLVPSAGFVTNGNYFNDIDVSTHVIQDEIHLMVPLKWGKHYLKLDPNNLTEHELIYLGRLYAKALRDEVAYFNSCAEWESFYQTTNPYLTIGSRLHCGIVSLNCGVPAIVTNEDSRARETCTYLGIPLRPEITSDINPRIVASELDLDQINTRYNHCYSRYLDFLKIYDISPKQLQSDGSSTYVAHRHEMAATLVAENASLIADASSKAILRAQHQRRIDFANYERSLLDYKLELQKLEAYAATLQSKLTGGESRLSAADKTLDFSATTPLTLTRRMIRKVTDRFPKFTNALAPRLKVLTRRKK